MDSFYSLQPPVRKTRFHKTTREDLALMAEAAREHSKTCVSCAAGNMLTPECQRAVEKIATEIQLKELGKYNPMRTLEELRVFAHSALLDYEEALRKAEESYGYYNAMMTAFETMKRHMEEDRVKKEVAVGT